jgi:hypothetical protein
MQKPPLGGIRQIKKHEDFGFPVCLCEAQLQTAMPHYSCGSRSTGIPDNKKTRKFWNAGALSAARSPTAVRVRY